MRGLGAFITGAANGIGLGIAKALATEGANIVLADIDPGALEKARAQVAALGVQAHALTLDVSDRAAFAEAAQNAIALLGKIHIVCNNAGVSLGPVPIADVAEPQWDWILGVNLRGVINGIAAFLPHLRDHGEPAHIVNTASIGGLQVNPGLNIGSYCATKYGVVAITEQLALELQDTAIEVSVLCPALVTTTLRQSAERRPARFGGPVASPVADGPKHDARMLSTGAAMTPEAVGHRVLAAIRNRDFFIFTHAHTRAWIEARHARLMAGFDQLDAYLADR